MYRYIDNQYKTNFPALQNGCFPHTPRNIHFSAFHFPWPNPAPARDKQHAVFLNRALAQSGAKRKGESHQPLCREGWRSYGVLVIEINGKKRSKARQNYNETISIIFSLKSKLWPPGPKNDQIFEFFEIVKYRFRKPPLCRKLL